MDALVAHVAATGVVIPMPVVVWVVAALGILLRSEQLSLRSRSAPQFVVDLFWNSERRIALADGRARLEARADDVLDASQLAAVNVVDVLPNRFMRAALRAALDNLFVLVRGAHQLPAF